MEREREKGQHLENEKHGNILERRYTAIDMKGHSLLFL